MSEEYPLIQPMLLSGKFMIHTKEENYVSFYDMQEPERHWASEQKWNNLAMLNVTLCCWFSHICAFFPYPSLHSNMLASDVVEENLKIKLSGSQLSNFHSLGHYLNKDSFLQNNSYSFKSAHMCVWVCVFHYYLKHQCSLEVWRF